MVAPITRAPIATNIAATTARQPMRAPHESAGSGSLCRSFNIPARYVFGYLPDMEVPIDPAPMDFAAWMEVWLADRWWTFDPRNNIARKGRVVIGRGRDASDVAMATTFGGPRLNQMTVHAQEVVS